ncbi:MULTISPECIES: hypothetical protein [unclassified Prochlorococcus]|uniref:hypothetical protein n=1 Tax=unclassified Prochlorococcus TaxID=2627481 RepID=UPI0005338A35|nr:MULTISPECIES: hypothetical protein [unclassified Prochlorococcus]KGG15048.1 hypothetical protein EV06_0911 [Prochlorococcus sp. MIT 0602]KGG17319.1 hypothetical protein EV07_0757 [Prochlorococcus sp. MIT 0603]
MNKLVQFFIAIQFGELELSTTTVSILVVITLFIFLAVGISSFKLIQSAFDSEDED